MSREHLGWPFGAPATDQGSDQELRDCATVALLYRPGDRPDAPTFGARPGAHRQGGVDLAALANRLERIDDRLDPLITGNDPILLQRLRRAGVTVAVRGGTT